MTENAAVQVTVLVMRGKVIVTLIVIVLDSFAVEITTANHSEIFTMKKMTVA